MPSVTTLDRVQVWPEVADTEAVGFVGREAVELAASYVPAMTSERHASLYHQGVTEQSARVRALRIAPGMIQVRVFDPRSKDAPLSEDLEEWAQGDLFDDEDDDEHKEGPVPTRGVITEMSKKAKLRLVRKAASVDWAESLTERRDADPSVRYVMVTLTYPGDWRRWCPNPETLTKHRRNFEKRAGRATGYPPTGLWKREFQRRKAPHIHYWMAAPMTVDGQAFSQWLSQTWYDVVGSGDERHLRAGTRVDWNKSLDMSDTARVAVYFAGYSINKDKGYQDDPPDDWHTKDGSIGRSWGAVGLTDAIVEREITDQVMTDIRRYVRKAYKAKRRPDKRRRIRIDPETGEIVSRRYKTRRRKVRSYTSGKRAGFTYFSSVAPLFTIQIARALALDDQPPWPKGQRRPLP